MSAELNLTEIATRARQGTYSRQDIFDLLADISALREEREELRNVLLVFVAKWPAGRVPMETKKRADRILQGEERE